MVEFKKDTKQKPRPEQIKWLQLMPNNAFLIGDFETFKKLIDESKLSTKASPKSGIYSIERSLISPSYAKKTF